MEGQYAREEEIHLMDDGHDPSMPQPPSQSSGAGTLPQRGGGERVRRPKKLNILDVPWEKPSEATAKKNAVRNQHFVRIGTY
jgi:hypothetical protein